MNNIKKPIGFTFGGKGIHKDFTKSKLRLKQEAIDTGWFGNFIAYDQEFINKFDNSQKGAGVGFWFWKPALALETMNNSSPDDIIVYMDAGCSIYKTDSSEKRFFEYVELCDKGPGFVGFGGGDSNVPLEIQYTKRDTLLLLGCDNSDYWYTSQISSGIWFVKNNQFGRNLMEDWFNACQINHLINWEKSYNEEHPEFISHKHDQGVFSVLCKKRRNLLNNCFLNAHEISHDITNIDPNLNFPIKAMRLDDSML
jgi:hypothetical protein